MADSIPHQPQVALYHYRAYVTDVYDGDTLTVDLDLGLGLWRHQQKIRLWKIDTAELRGEERTDGLAVRDFVRELILHKSILVRTILDKRGQDRTGKFGRLLGEVLVEDDTGELINLNELLLAKGLATPLRSDGTRMRSVAFATQLSLPHGVSCSYCGEWRWLDKEAGLVASCPNCLDSAYMYRIAPQPAVEAE